MRRVKLPASQMNDDAKQPIRENRPVQLAGYEWAFTCSCGAVAEPDASVTDETVVVCGDCGAEWEISITRRDEDGENDGE